MSRYSAYILSIVMTLVSLALARWQLEWWWGVAIFGALAGLGSLVCGIAPQMRINHLVNFFRLLPPAAVI